MAWTTPATVVADSTELTASLWNQQVRDNTSFLYSPASCALDHTGNQTISNGTWTSVTFTAPDLFDTDNMHSTSSNTSRITINTAGIYLLTANIEWTSQATGFRASRIYVDGSTIISSDQRTTVSGDSTISALSGIYRFTAGQYVELQGYQNTGAPLNIISGQTNFAASWLGQF